MTFLRKYSKKIDKTQIMEYNMYLTIRKYKFTIKKGNKPCRLK